MSEWPLHPIVYEINTWVWLEELSQEHGRRVTLGTVPTVELERLADLGFGAIWLMGVWQRSPASRRIARCHPGLLAEFRAALPDFSPADVAGSPYAVYRYEVDPSLGDAEGLASLRSKLAEKGLRLILDFVPNHLAVDHAWVHEHPERLMHGIEADLVGEPDSYFRAAPGTTAPILAHGRDPNFPGWTDTVQLDYRRPGTRRAMTDVLLTLAARCDGLRCDMAMLIMHDVYVRTWGGETEPQGAEFWSDGISQVRARYPGFLFLAEAYWDLEWDLQQLGFDYTYDKRLYDRLLGGNAESVRGHLGAALDYQRHLARFVENHDECRAAEAFGPAGGRAAAALCLTLPGLRLLHEGQLEGRRTRLPVQLGRRRPEPLDPETAAFYRRLLAAVRDPVFHDGEWKLLDSVEAWPGNRSNEAIIAHQWTLGEEIRVTAMNLSPGNSQCFVRLDRPELPGGGWRFDDLVGEAEYVRDGTDLADRGLFLDMVGHGAHLFSVSRA